MIYGAECWATTVKEEQILRVGEMRMLRDHVRNEDTRKKLGASFIHVLN